MSDALYGPDGFYTAGAPPALHYRTSPHASDLYAAAVAELANRAGTTTVVDLGAGRGEMLAALRDLDPSLTLLGVDVVPRPPTLCTDIGWYAELPERGTGPVLVIANEWLDNIPVDVVERTADGPRLVLVDDNGTERLGPPPRDTALSWLGRWWPRLFATGAVGERAEVGLARDEAWAGVLEWVRGTEKYPGLAVAVDYAHSLGCRPPDGTLLGYFAGRAVAPIPDGECDITAHVALDAVAEAGRNAGATETQVRDQRSVLRALGLTGRRPDRELAEREPVAYLRELERSSQAAELMDPAGLGGFGWLIQAVSIPIPPL